MSENTAMSLIEYGAGGTVEPPPPPPEDEGQPGGGRLRKPQRPVGMGTGGKPGAAAAVRPSFTGPNRLKHGLKPGQEPAEFIQHGSRDPERELLRSGGLDREMTADDVLDAYRAALAGGGQKYMSNVSRMGGAVGMPNIGRPQVPGMESDARKVANLLLDGSDEEAASMVEEAKKAKGKMVAKSPGTVKYTKESVCCSCGKEVGSECFPHTAYTLPKGHPRRDSVICGNCHVSGRTTGGPPSGRKYVQRPPDEEGFGYHRTQEDCGVKYPGHGLSTKGKGKKAKTVAKSPGKVKYTKESSQWAADRLGLSPKVLKSMRRFDDLSNVHPESGLSHDPTCDCDTCEKRRMRKRRGQQRQ